MKAILRIPETKKGVFGSLSRLFTPPLRSEILTREDLSVPLYTLNPLWKPLFPGLVRSLGKKYDTLLFDKSMKACSPLYREPSVSSVFFQRLKDILPLLPCRILQNPTIICEECDHRISIVLEALSSYAKVVTVVTTEDAFFEEIARDAMLFFGLSLNQREADSHSALAILLSLKSKTNILAEAVIPLCDTDFISDAPVLADFSSRTTGDFFSAFPQIDVTHCFFVSKNQTIRNLIWKISKKS